jgi:hypothetical protein
MIEETRAQAELVFSPESRRGQTYVNFGWQSGKWIFGGDINHTEEHFTDMRMIGQPAQ